LRARPDSSAQQPATELERGRMTQPVAAAVANKISIRGPTPFQPVEKSLENKVVVEMGTRPAAPLL